MEVNLEKIHSEIDCFFQPQTVAVIGASTHPEKVGYGIVKNLISGGIFSLPHLEGFSGKVYPVNPNAEEILGLKCYTNINDIPAEVDLAIICVPAEIVPKIMKDCAKKGIKGATVISAGFGEFKEKGKKLQRKFLETAKYNNIRVIGPNCLGTLYTPRNLNASFGPFAPKKGDVAFISQSGALADSVIDWSVKQDYGFSAVVSYGNKADLDAPDFIGWAAKDPHTKAIALYIEGFNDGRYFLDLARKVTPLKPIVSLKAGRSSVGTKAVSSHTGSLAGSYRVYKGAYKQAGVIMAGSLREMFDITNALVSQKPAEGNRVAIVTNGGGNGVLCADYCEDFGIKLPPLSEEIIKELDNSGDMHPAWNRDNPLDIVGDAGPARYKIALEKVMESDQYDGVIVIQALQTTTESKENARVVVEIQKKYNKPVIAAFMGGTYTEPGVKYLKKNNIPNYNDVDRAAKAMSALGKYGSYLRRYPTCLRERHR